MGSKKKNSASAATAGVGVGGKVSSADKKQWYEKAKATKEAKKQLGLPISVGKLRRMMPPNQRFGRGALEWKSLYIGFWLKKLVEDLKRETENGKHLVSPQMLANIFNNEKRATVFPYRVAGVYRESRAVRHRPKKDTNETSHEEEEAPQEQSAEE